MVLYLFNLNEGRKIGDHGKTVGKLTLHILMPVVHILLLQNNIYDNVIEVPKEMSYQPGKFQSVEKKKKNRSVIGHVIGERNSFRLNLGNHIYISGALDMSEG